MMKTGVIPVIATLVTAWFLASSPAQQKKMKLVTREVSLGKVHPGFIDETFLVSPDSRHIAYVASRDGKLFVVIDGVEGKKYDRIGDPFTLVFSPDSKRVAYVAFRGGNQLVVVDGIEGKDWPVRSRALGANAYIRKPFKPEVFMIVVKACLAGAVVPRQVIL